MNCNEAIEILKKRIEIDRKLRQNSTESDYDKFCENECIAIETLIDRCTTLEDRQNKAIAYINWARPMALEEKILKILED